MRRWPTSARAGDLRVPRDGGPSAAPAPGPAGRRPRRRRRCWPPASSSPTGAAGGHAADPRPPATAPPSPPRRPARRPSSSSRPARRPTRRTCRRGRSCRAATSSRPSRTSDPAYYDLTRRALDRAAALAPGDHATTVTEGVLALSLHDFAGALEQGSDRPRSRWPRTRTRCPSSSTRRSSSATTTTPTAHVAELLERRPGSAALSRLSYLRELHGDLEGARLAMLQAEQATSAAYDRATIATFVGDQLLAGAGPDRGRQRLRAGPARPARPDDHRHRAGPAPGRGGPPRRRHRDGRRASSTARRRRPRPRSSASSSRLRDARRTPPPASPWPRRGPSCSSPRARPWTSSRPCSPPTTATRPTRSRWRGGPTPLARPSSPPTPLGWALTRSGRAAEALPYVDRGAGPRHPLTRAPRARRPRLRRRRAGPGRRGRAAGGVHVVRVARPGAPRRRRRPGRSARSGRPARLEAVMRHRTLLGLAASAAVAATVAGPDPPRERPSAGQPHRQHLRRHRGGRTTPSGSTTWSTSPSCPPSRRSSGSTRTATAPASASEMDAYRTAECTTLASGLEVSLGSDPVRVASGASSLRFLPGQGGLQTLRLECALARCRPRSPVAAGSASTTPTSPIASGGGRSR